jgi:hypothetical protein
MILNPSCGGVNDISCFVLCVFRVTSFVSCYFESLNLFVSFFSPRDDEQSSYIFILINSDL